MSSSELKYLDEKLKSTEDFNNDFYTDDEGQNLEVLLQFLTCHKQDINLLMNDPSQKDVLITLYTSSVISGNYDCFRFDLDKFEQSYNPAGKVLSIYRVGRENENCSNLGNSWSKSYSGLKNYVKSSSIDALSRPVFEAKINDSEILSEIMSQEDELILKKKFTVNSCRELGTKEKQQMFR